MATNPAAVGVTRPVPNFPRYDQSLGSDMSILSPPPSDVYTTAPGTQGNFMFNSTHMNGMDHSVASTCSDISLEEALTQVQDLLHENQQLRGTHQLFCIRS